VINEPGTEAGLVLAPGVLLDCHIGRHNRARDLTTGLVTFEPGARLDYHSHPFVESITVLTGGIIVSVEGRKYSLGPLDNIAIPQELAHVVSNARESSPTTVHVALNSSDPIRKAILVGFDALEMPPYSTGVRGKEHITRKASAAQYEAGPGTSFIDFFNGDLVPGIQMSGGFAKFQPGGRLPAHVHYFDESIYIIQGMATCVVEGRRHRLKSFSTALQPRGRIHYFVNEGWDEMAMIWVYAGPTPERVVLDESCATIEGNPWRRGNR
jgi:quercetin dioxygenase-like cupin family protein